MAKILVVDDDTAVRTFVTRALHQHGHAVVPAADGDDALAVLARERDIVLLVTDIVMPGMDGIELAQAATARRPELKVLLMTGFADGRSQAHESAHGFLSKPFSLVTVCATVDDLLQGNGG